jgi:hypothetical protein
LPFKYQNISYGEIRTNKRIKDYWSGRGQKTTWWDPAEDDDDDYDNNHDGDDENDDGIDNEEEEQVKEDDNNMYAPDDNEPNADVSRGNLNLNPKIAENHNINKGNRNHEALQNEVKQRAVEENNDIVRVRG